MSESVELPAGEPPSAGGRPQAIGPYRVVRLLAEGGMGEVYEGYDDRLDRPVALKCVLSESGDSDKARARFRREARSVARLSHASIVQVYDWVESGASDWIVMELVDGRPLNDLLIDDPPDLRQAVQLARDIAAGLAVAHAAGVVHRDLKAANIMVTADEGDPGRAHTGRAKILDFGIAKRLPLDSESLLTTVTEAGVIVGTVSAMSPEQAKGRAVDARSDLFSLGTLFYQMVTGIMPFYGHSPVATLTRICTVRQRPAAEENSEVPVPVSDLIDHLLEKEPSERPQKADEVVAALDAYLAGQTLPSSTSTRRQKATGERTLVDGLRPVPGAEPGTAVVRTLLASDLTARSELISSLGDVRAVELFKTFDRLSRDLLAKHGGWEIDKSDGFLMLFERPLAAVVYAIELHRQLAALDGDDKARLSARIGIHLGEIVVRENAPEDVTRGARPFEVEGLAKSMTARLMSLASGGQVLLTQGAFDLARRGVVAEVPEADKLRWLAHGGYHLEDLDESVEVFEVGEEGLAPLSGPADSVQARRAVAPGDEIALGWRPALGQHVPRRRHWELVDKLGEGGFGEVWLAVHQKTFEKRVFKFCFEAERLRALQREVALFRLLRESLGQRDDIARILDWDFDEAPYFLESEHTEGGSLPDWAQAQGGIDQVPLETRLELIAGVAEALAAAHSVGVLHKDVKPANVLITTDRDGRPLAVLTDFGVGQVTDRSLLVAHGITSLGFTGADLDPNDSVTGGTRIYTAPELLSGAVPTVQADIYALGVMLYQVAVGDLDRPLAPGWRRDIPDALLCEDIATFVDGKRDQRPQSVLEIAERLRSLEQRRAAREAERRAQEDAEKAQRRRRLLTTVASVSSVFLVIVTALAIQAFQARREAERGRAQAENLIEFMLFDLRDGLETISRLDLLEKVARSSREYFETLAPQGSSVDSMYKRGISLINIGDVLHDRGDSEAALESFRAAEALYRESLADHPDNPRWQEGLGKSLSRIGDMLRLKGDGDQALEAYRESLATASVLAPEPNSDPERRYDLARAHYKLALALARSGDNAAAGEPALVALDLVRALTGEGEEVHWRTWFLEIQIAKLNGEILENGFQFDRALDAYRAAEEVAERRSEEDPASSIWRELAADLHFRTGYIYLFREDLEPAHASYDRARAFFQDLATRDPTRTKWRAGLAQSQAMIADVHFHRQELADAEELYRASLEIFEDLVRIDPTRLNLRDWAAECHEELGRIHRQRGQPQAALESLNAALEVRLKLAEEDPSSSRRNGPGEIYLDIGEILAQQGDLGGARQSWWRALELVESASAESDSSWQRSLHAEALMRLGRFDEARPLVEHLVDKGWDNENFLELAREGGLL